MQHRLILFGVTLLAIAALGVSAFAQPHAIPLTLTNDTLTYPPLYFGIIPGADPCIDTTDAYLTYRELELPPLPDPTWQILSGALQWPLKNHPTNPRSGFIPGQKSLDP